MTFFPHPVAKTNNKQLRTAHLLLLCIGGVFLLSCTLHQNLWFDETYSVALARTDFSGLIQYASADVHPLFYYILLKLWSVIAGTSILSLRLFSFVGAQALAILGLTHIRRDFGARTGFWYSFIIYTLAAVVRYAGEIRMYTWLPFFATLTAIYAYRLYQTQKPKDYILFVLMSLCTAYTHYFGLVFVCLVNALLFFSILLGRKKKRFYLLAALLQLICYIPGFLILQQQLQSVKTGYWIEIQYPQVLFDTLAFFFFGDTPDQNTIFPVSQNQRMFCTVFGGLIFLAVLAGLIGLFIRRRNNKRSPHFTKTISPATPLSATTDDSSASASSAQPIHYVETHDFVSHADIPSKTFGTSSDCTTPGADTPSNQTTPLSAANTQNKTRSQPISTPPSKKTPGRAKQTSQPRKQTPISASPIVILFAFSLCILVIAAGLIASAMMEKSNIYYVRYIMVFIGLFAFVLASLLSKIRFFSLRATAAVIFVVLLVIRMVPLYQTVYDPKNAALDQFVEQNITANDLVIGADIEQVSIYAEKFSDRHIYLYTQDQWYEEIHYTAFSAYHPQMDFAKTMDDLPIQPGQTVWVLDDDQLSLTQKLVQTFNLSYLKQPQSITIPYHDVPFVLVSLQALS